MGRLTGWLAAMPAVLLACVTAYWLALGVVDRHPFWPQPSSTLSEATAQQDAGAVARLLELGVDPNGTYPVRAGYLGSDAALVSPLDAAAAVGNDEIEALLIQAGARRRDSPVSP